LDNDFGDEKLRFYLQHQKLIETWATVGLTEHQAAHKFLISLAKDLQQEVSASLGDAVQVHADAGSSQTSAYVGLCKGSWRDDNRIPRVMVCIGWSPEKVAFEPTRSGDKSPYVGIRVADGNKGGQPLLRILKFTFENKMARHGYGSSDWWPVWRYEPAAGDFWTDPTRYGRELVRSCVTLWQRYSAQIDLEVAKPAKPSAPSAATIDAEIDAEAEGMY
jgi:hypothetical protein